VRKQGVPFRWNVGNPRLGRRLGRTTAHPTPPEVEEALLRTAARVVRAAGDADLVFVGRSPESLLDLLAGAFERTTWRERLQLLQLSLRRPLDRLRRERPQAVDELGRYLWVLGLLPSGILERRRPVAFVDLVYNGQTFGNLVEVLRGWASPALWAEVKGRLRWVCLLEQHNPTSRPWTPGESDWTALFPNESVSCVAVDSWFWRFLADRQPKTTDPYTPERWGNHRFARPSQRKERLQAARLARSIFRLGERRRALLASELGRPPVPEPWLQALIRELRLR
jgi:hypothetical protein